MKKIKAMTALFLLCVVISLHAICSPYAIKIEKVINDKDQYSIKHEPVIH